MTVKFCRDCDYMEQDRWDWYCTNLEAITRDKYAKGEILVYGKDEKRVKLKCTTARRNDENCGVKGRFYEAKNA